MNQELTERYKQWMIAQRNNNEKTVKLMLTHTKWFFEWLKKKKLSINDVTQDIVDDYIVYCKERYSKNTLVTITANLRKLLVHFLKRKDIEIKVVQTSSPKRDKTPLTREEVNAMLEAAKENPLDEAILKTLYYSGMRKSELISLDIEDIDFENLKITVRYGKGDTYRRVNITKDCAMAIKKWLAVRPQPEKGDEKALFISVHRKRISKSYIRDIVKIYAAKAGIEKTVYPHKFRITHITHMAEANLDIKEIQAQTGHKDIKTLMRYIQYSSEKIRKSYEKVFERNDDDIIHTHNPPETETNAEYYKKLAFKKYLDGEINRKMLNEILETFDGKDEIDERIKDIAYS